MFAEKIVVAKELTLTLVVPRFRSAVHGACISMDANLAIVHLRGSFDCRI